MTQMKNLLKGFNRLFEQEESTWKICQLRLHSEKKEKKWTEPKRYYGTPISVPVHAEQGVSEGKERREHWNKMRN